CILVYKLLQGDGWCVPNIPSHGADPSTHVTIRGLPSTACEATPLFTMHYTLQHDTFLRTTMFLPLYHVYYSCYLCYFMSLYPFTERHAQPYFFSCFDTAGHDYDLTSSVRRGALKLWYQSQMVNTRTDADLSAAVQNALQTLLPQIRAEIHEEFRTSSGPSDACGNPPPAKGGDAWLITVTWADFKKLFFLQFFP
nr:hypothetical protein [Tanacetum cinerariifolium]